jgi:two-component system sensor histidine kinase/response regulator
VLLDVEMPRMGGVAAVRRIRAQPQHRHLPVLALTAHSDPSDLARLVEAGMDDHIVKPFDPDALAAAVSTWIARARERRR